MRLSEWFRRLALVLVFSIAPITVFGDGHPGFGWPNNNGKADNRNHYACWNDSGSWPQELVNYHAWWNGHGYYYTGLVILYYTPNACHYLDDMWMDDNLTGAYGSTTCQVYQWDEFDGTLCLQYSVSISQSQHQSLVNTIYWNYYDAAYSTWCHEIGHSYGIHHGYWPNSCTNSPMTPSGARMYYSSGEYTEMSSQIPIYSGPWL